MDFIHIQLTVGFNESPDDYWRGTGEESIKFSVPVEMYNGANLAKLVDAAIKNAKEKFPKAKAEEEERQRKYNEEYEERQRQKAEAEALKALEPTS